MADLVRKENSTDIIDKLRQSIQAKQRDLKAAETKEERRALAQSAWYETMLMIIEQAKAEIVRGQQRIARFEQLLDGTTLPPEAEALLSDEAKSLNGGRK